MNNTYCKDCYFDGVCEDEYGCDGVYADMDLIEANRISYRAEWFEYIEEFEN